MNVLCRVCQTTKPGESVKLCKGCKMVYYCSEQCQKKDWKSHKIVCKQVQEGVYRMGDDVKLQEMSVWIDRRLSLVECFMRRYIEKTGYKDLVITVERTTVQDTPVLEVKENKQDVVVTVTVGETVEYYRVISISFQRVEEYISNHKERIEDIKFLESADLSQVMCVEVIYEEQGHFLCRERDAKTSENIERMCGESFARDKDPLRSMLASLEMEEIEKNQSKYFILLSHIQHENMEPSLMASC